MSDENKIDSQMLLEPMNMLSLYARGAFPMADKGGEIHWYMPKVRAVIPLNKYNVPRSLKAHIKKMNFEYRIDSATFDVIKLCAQRDETWISKELIAAYKNLIKLGNLHSVEVFSEKKLVGGLFGITYRGAFFGESMFSLVEQASKAALVYLIEHLRKKGFVLLDVQFATDHLKMFGAVEIDFEAFTDKLIEAYLKEVYFR
ncbi:MAG: leucyl/phenylalanyl-tRNA--protein transferase [Bacteroidetes bacterium]|nr:leucyl/phenylalanyl-tRNA--protein transferase [Bacteroidota bacterium]